MAARGALLARGPWRPDQVRVDWLEDAYEAPPEIEVQADRAVDALRERGSPCHDGLSTRLASYAESPAGLALELQPSRWALRLVDEDASSSLTALCAVRTEDGRWLAGRRAGWVSTWANRWALGAGGAVDLGESPAETLPRELAEEWQLEPVELTVEALVTLPNGMAMVVGMATVADSSEPVPDAEHESWEWWDPDPDRWPKHADDRVRLMGRLLAAGA
jgi:ADP-ribose pyrophosphatase YjhB (NUDIX family)